MRITCVKCKCNLILNGVSTSPVTDLLCCDGRHNIERPDGKDRVEYDRSEKILPEVYLVPMQRKKQKHALAYIVDDPKSAHLVTFYKFENW